MDSSKVIVKFEQVTEQSQGPVTRIVGLVKASHMLGLFDVANLEANPRSAKAGSVTQDIRDSIENSPDLFPFKTKGVLVGASRCETLQRNRYELHFVEPNIEGILDGGHNMLAIGTQILSGVMDDERELRRIKMWDDFKEAWKEHRAEINEMREYFSFTVPIEILIPANQEDEEVVEEFRTSLLDICAARNNNAELTRETRANKKGFYDNIRGLLPPEISKRIEWKTNDGGDVKVRDVIALSWIPLSLLDLPNQLRVSPQNIYRNKGECTRVFDELMNDPTVSAPQGGGPVHKLINSEIESAFKILASLPDLYDKIYLDFPEAYNKAGGSFGKISVVKLYDPSRRDKDDKNPKFIRTQPHSHFTSTETKYRYPDGLIMPLIYGLKALMSLKDGEIRWVVDPVKFLDRYFVQIVDAYSLVLDMAKFDPQKVGKNETSYKIAVSEYEKALMKTKVAA